MNLYHPVIVGGVRLPGNLFLAPVAGYSDAAFRSVCFELGADLCYTEMVSAEALTRGHPKTGLLMDRAENETCYAIQLFGSKPDTLAAATRIAAARGPTLIDLNCGCPVPKVVRSGAGSALMKDPDLIRRIVAAMVAALGPCGPPVTAKIRSGWEEGGAELPRGGRRGRRGRRRGRDFAREDARPGLFRPRRLEPYRGSGIASGGARIRLGRRFRAGRRRADDR